MVLENLDRVAAVYATGLMDVPRRPELDEFARTAANRLQTPIALMTLIDDHRQYFVGHFDRESTSTGPQQTSLEVSYCKYVVTRDSPLAISDATADPLVRELQPTVSGAVRSYLGVPLRSPSGEVLGSFCVVDRIARDWTDWECRRLETYAQSAMRLVNVKDAAPRG